MKFYKYSVVAVLMLASQLSTAGGETSLGEVTAITLYKTHTGILVNHVNAIDPDTCGRNDYFIFPKTHPYYTEGYSLLLAAHMSGKKVRLVIEGCHEGIPAIKHIRTN